MTARLKANRKKRGHVSAGNGRIGKGRKHPGGHGNAGVQHHHRINFDKYHPGYIGKVGMRHFCFRKNKYVEKLSKVNVEKLWAILGEDSYKSWKAKKDSGKAPVIDCTKAGFFKVLGKGPLPQIPIVVKARFFSRKAEMKINAVGGVCLLDA